LKISAESKRWVELGIIDDAGREQILALYTKKHSINPIFVIFAILGSLLIGSGIILIFATNWNNIPRAAKVCISFLPLTAAMGVFLFTLLKRYNSPAFREGAALGLCLAIFASNALIGQVFHIPSDTEVYLRLCMYLILPAVYLLEAKASAAVYTACAIISGAYDYSILISPYEDFRFLIALPGIILFAPFLITQIKKAEHKAVIRYLSILAGALLAFLIFNMPGEWEEFPIKFLACAVIILTADALIKRLKGFDGAMPLTPVACLTILFVLALSSFRDLGFFSLWDDIGFPIGLVVLICAFIFYWMVRFYNNSNNEAFEIKPPDTVAICALLGCALFWLWSNVLLAAAGVWLIVLGIKNIKMKTVNYGMLLVVFVILARFFDSGLGLMERGVAFVVIGVGFFLTNYLLYKRWRPK